MAHKKNQPTGPEELPEDSGPNDVDRVAPGADNPPDGRTQTDARLEEARKATERGWAMTPLDGKKPIRRGWQKAPMPPLDAVEAWAREGNVGLRTGAISGVVVIDDDTEDGVGVADLDLPATVTVDTGSGKRHYYFRRPDGGITNAPGNLPKGVDVRGDGGQVVFVGSIHPDTGEPYRWAPGLSPDEIELAELPQAVLDLIKVKRAKVKKAPKQRTRKAALTVDEGAHEALTKAASVVASASEGSRNKTLNAEAFRLGRWLNAGLLNRHEAEGVLATAAATSGLPDSEIRATLASGLDAGIIHPLRLDADPVADANVSKPGIMLEGGELPRVVQEAEAALIHADVSLFQRGSMVVRVVRAPATTMRDVYSRAQGVLMLCEVDCPYLVEVLTANAFWYRRVKEDLVVVDCPERIARTYLSRAGHWKLRTLLGVIESPTLRPDGSVVSKPGFDEATGLYFDPNSAGFPDIPENATRTEAIAALERLKVVLKDFPFLEPSDRSAALAAILTSLIRKSIRTAPLFAFRAPKMASGKSLLADVVAMISTGRVASVMSQGKDEDEDKKRLLAILIEGISVACIDNIERDFGGAALCTVLTQESWRERVLGKTGTATVPTATTWLATGNNVRFVGDIVTRVVPCDLDSGLERPEEREFDVNLHEYVPAHRGDLVAAGLTVLRAFHVAGRPDQGLSVFGRFEEWSGWVRSALVWLGEADPCDGRKRLYEYDPVGSQLKALLVAWHALHQDRALTASELINTSSRTTAGKALEQAILSAAAGKDGTASVNRLGSYLAKYERRTEGGLRIERMGDRQGSALWRVIPVGPGPDGGAEPDSAVGLVGDVGHFQPVQDSNSRSEMNGGGEQTQNECESRPGPTGKVPRNPQDPRSPALPPRGRPENAGRSKGKAQPSDTAEPSEREHDRG